MGLFDYFLSSFKFYRRRRGGKWYFVRSSGHGSGMTDNNVEYWVRTPRKEHDVLKTEEY